MPVLRFWNGTAWADLAAGLGVPPGGTTGQVLSKKSTTDYDTQWATPSAGGTNVLQVYEANAVTGATVTLPVTPTSVTTVSLNGQLLQQTRDWTISGSVITFTTALTADDVHVEYLTGPYTGSNADQVDGIDAVPASAPAAGKLVATDSYAKLPPSILTPMANLLTNGGFEIWQRGTSTSSSVVAAIQSFADMWQAGLTASGGNLAISRDSANADGAGYCMSCVFTYSASNSAYVVQYVKEQIALQLAGRTFSVSVRVKTSTANAVRLGVNDNVNAYTYSPYHTGNGQYQTLTVTRTLPATGTQIGVVIWADGGVGATYYIDNAMLVIGPEPVDYLPMHPADDLARCLRYYEISGTSQYVAGGYNAAGATIYVSIPYKAIKPITPTVTKVGTWGTSNAGQPSFPWIDGVQTTMTYVVTAAGAAFVQGPGGAGGVTVEANP